MKRLEEHLGEILATITPLAPLDLQLLDAHGLTLLEDVASPLNLPSFDNAAMDGYAVRAEDVRAATESTPVELSVTGDIAAGSEPAYALLPGLTARIMTGAPMPRYADAVVPVEWTDRGLARVAITRTVEPGAHVRYAGEDVRAGAIVLSSGTVLNAPQVGVLAAIGRDRVRVQPKPRVVIMSTGDELVEPGHPLGAAQIYDANGYLLSCAAREAGAIVYRVGVVPDDPRRLLDTLEDQLIRADLVLTTGGVSKGAYDVVKEVLARLGTVRFDEVAMQPGKPQGFGTVGPDATPIFTLPGNPVSSYVSFEIFVRPALRRLAGHDDEDLFRPVVRARSLSAFPSAAGRRQFMRGRVAPEGDGFVVSAVGGPGSHLMGSLAQANALIVVPEAVTQVPVGGTVEVMVLDERVVA
jgi:molybdopterin molybdotransferase